MKKIILILLLLPNILFAYPIKDIQNDLLITTMLNMQTEDYPLPGDYPKITIKEPYFWNLSYENKGQNYGGVSIPVGAVADTELLRIKYKINSLNECNVVFGCRYNTNKEYDLDYVAPLGAVNIPKFEYNLENPQLAKECVCEIKNPRYNSDNFGFASAVYINFKGAGSCDIDIYSIELINSKKEVFNVFFYDWDMRAFALPPNVTKEKIQMSKNTVYIGMWTPEVACEEGRNRILRLKELIPNLGCDCSSQATCLLNFKDFFLQNNIPAYYQSCGVIDIEPVVSEYKAHSVDINGNSRDVNPRYGVTPHHFHDMTDVNIKNSYKKAVEILGDYGVCEFQFIDSVWPYWDGNNFGYGEKAIKEYRKALLGTDGGINYGPYGQEGKNITFFDYLKENTGLEITPSDCGINSWDEFVPYPNGFTPDEIKIKWQEKNNLPERFNIKSYFVFNALKRYEYLKHYSDIGEVGVKHGCNLAAMPNGDNWANANDYIGLLQLRDLKTVIDETRFYHPICTMSAYSSLPVWRNIAKKYNKHHRIITEIGPGGGADIYWEPKLSYILQYTVQNIGHYDSMQTDWIYGGIHENSDPRGQKAWFDFLCKAYGYNDATSDSGEKEKSDIIFLKEPLGINVYDRLPSRFNDLDTDYNKTVMDIRAWHILKPSPKLLVLDTMNIPLETANEISKSVKSNKMNILLNSYIPGVESDGNNYTNYWYDAHKINNSELFGTLIGGVSKGQDVEIDDYKGEYYEIEKKGKVLVRINDIPVLTKITSSKSNIYYYHLNAGVSEKTDNLVLETVCNDLKIKKESNSENAYTMRFKLNNGAEAVAVYNKSVMESHKWPNIEFNYYEINAPGAKASAEFATNISGKYIVYDFLNKKIIDENTDKNIKIDMNDMSANLYFIIPKTKESFIDTLKERYDKIKVWYEKFNL